MTSQFHPQAKGNTQSGHDHGEKIAKKAKLCKYVPTFCVLPPAADHKAFALRGGIKNCFFTLCKKTETPPPPFFLVFSTAGALVVITV